jgi:hypothetical protein
VRGEKSATRKAIPNRPNKPNKTSIQILVGASPPVTGITPGVVTTTTVGGTRVTSGGGTVSCNLTAVCGAPDDPKALKNMALRITIENKMVLSFMVTPFRNRDIQMDSSPFVLYNEQA